MQKLKLDLNYQKQKTFKQIENRKKPQTNTAMCMQVIYKSVKRLY